jgi:hypothetical protein
MTINPTNPNSGFLGAMNFNSGVTELDGAWTGMGNVSVGYAYYGSMATVTGNASLGMASGKNFALTGGTNSLGTTILATLAPTKGTMTIGMQGNSNTVSFQSKSQLTLNLNDTLADGVTPVADSLAVKGALDLGTGATTNVLAINFSNISKFKSYTLATFDSISSVQTQFGSVVVNGVTLAGDGTALSSIDAGLAGYGGHHLVYSADSLVAQMELIPGDINGDGLVDVADYNIWAANVGKTGATWDQGDLNGDGLVDVADYNIWAANVGKTSATPEPISMIILAIGGGLVGLKRRNG